MSFALFCSAAALSLLGNNRLESLQVHLSLSDKPGSMEVLWSTNGTAGSNSQVVWGTDPHQLTEKAPADELSYRHPVGSGDNEHFVYFWTHHATLSNLESNQVYYYQVGDDLMGRSAVFNFTFARKRPEGEPYLHLVIGDMGSGHAYALCDSCTSAWRCICNDTSKGFISERDHADMLLHTGDYGYNFEEFSGTNISNADYYFTNIEPFAAYVPYMGTRGNHEVVSSAVHFVHRFRHWPVNADIKQVLTRWGGPVANVLYHSWDMNMVHYVAIDPELLFHDSWNTTEKVGGVTWNNSLAWLKKDLEKANKNRDNVPWIVVTTHRAVYCSSYPIPPKVGTDCDPDATRLREQVEEMFMDYGVDFFINGHQHNYERSWPVYQGKAMHSNVDPKAPIYIVNGAAGSREWRDPFPRPCKPWNNFRSNSFSYSRLYIYNHTHIRIQEVVTEPELFPGHPYGSVIDEAWFVQNNHGPFNRSFWNNNSHIEERFLGGTLPPSVQTCKTNEHWTSVLVKGLNFTTSRPMHEQLNEYEEKHGRHSYRKVMKKYIKEIEPAAKFIWEDLDHDHHKEA